VSQSVLIIQPDKPTSDQLSLIFKEWGDQVQTSLSLKAAGEKLRISLPDLLVIDITLLGSNWPKSILKLKERFQKTALLFTYSSEAAVPKQYFSELVKWQVITLPLTPERVTKALQGKMSQTDILEVVQRKSRLTYPIRFQISWPYLILSLFFTLTAAYITTRVIFDSAEERYANQLIEAGKLSAEWMVLEEDHLLESLRLAINTNGIAEEVIHGNENNLHQMIYPLAVNAQIEDIEILDSEGLTIYSLHHQPGSTIEDYQTSTGGAYFQSLEIVSAILGQQTDDFGDKYGISADPPWGKTFYVAGPITSSGEVIGIAMIGKSLPSLVQSMRATTLAQTTLYDLQGQVLATTFIAGEELPAGLTSQILTLQGTSTLPNNITVADINYPELLAPWKIRDNQDIGVLGAALPQSYLVHTNWITRTQIFIALGVFISLILIIGYRLANRISKPLESLAKASEQVAEGNFLVALESPGSNEVAVLTRSFNKMLKSLESTQAELLDAYDNSLEGWSRALSLRDHDTDEHSRRVVELTLQMAKILGIEKVELEDIRRGALLHDIGKVGIPDEILRKTGPLSNDEWLLMKKHPLYAVEMLQPVNFLQGALEIPLYHHERWDGSGYPYGLKGDAIPLSARIFAVADVYDALISDRPYREAWSRRKALQYLIENKGIHFDAQIIDLFIQEFAEKIN